MGGDPGAKGITGEEGASCCGGEGAAVAAAAAREDESEACQAVRSEAAPIRPDVDATGSGSSHGAASERPGSSKPRVEATSCGGGGGGEGAPLSRAPPPHATLPAREDRGNTGDDSETAAPSTAGTKAWREGPPPFAGRDVEGTSRSIREAVAGGVPRAS